MVCVHSFGTGFVNWIRSIPERVSNWFAKLRGGKRSEKIANQQDAHTQVALGSLGTVSISGANPFQRRRISITSDDLGASSLTLIDRWHKIAKEEKETVRAQFSSASQAGTAIRNFIDSADFLDFDDNDDTVRKNFARRVLQEVLGGVDRTALDEDGISGIIGERLDELAKETELWERCKSGVSRDSTDRYPALTRLREAFQAVVPEFTSRMALIERP